MKSMYPRLIFFGSLLLFMFGQSQMEFVGFESRFTLFAQEMMRHGVSFFPTTYGQPYPDYTALSTLLILLCSLPFGEITHVSAVLPTAIAASLTVTLLYKLVALRDKTWALASCLCLLATLTFIAQARTIAIDQFVCLATIAAFYAVYRADYLQHKQPTLVVIACLIFGVLSRGPIGLIIPTGVLSSYYFLSQRYQQLIKLWLSATLLLILSWGLLLLGAYIDGGMAFVEHVIFMQVTSRIHTNSMVDPIYQYFTKSFGNYFMSYPIALLGMLLLAKKIWRIPEHENLKLVRYFCGYSLVILLGLSLSNRKPNHYVLAFAPSLSAIAAYFFCFDLPGLGQKVKTVLQKFFITLPLVLLLIVFAGQFYLQQKHPEISLATTWIMIGLLSIIIATRYFKTQHQAIPALASAAACLWLTQAMIIEPIEQQQSRTKQFAQQIEQIREQNQLPLAFYDITKDGLAIKWLVQLNKDIQPIFIKEANELSQNHQPYMLISKTRAYDKLPSSIKQNAKLIAEGKIGHRQVTVVRMEHPSA